MATDGAAFARWLKQAKIVGRTLTPEQVAVLQSAHCFLERCGRDYYSQRILGHYLLHCGTGLKVAQIARLVGVSRPTASEQQGIPSKQVVQAAHHRMAGRPHGKLLPRHAGSVAQFLITHPKASRLDILDFIERAWEVRVSTVALYHFMKKYGLDQAQRSLARSVAENPPSAIEVASGGRASGGRASGAAGALPGPGLDLPVASSSPPSDFFLPTRNTRGRSSSSRRR